MSKFKEGKAKFDDAFKALAIGTGIYSLSLLNVFAGVAGDNAAAGLVNLSAFGKSTCAFGFMSVSYLFSLMNPYLYDEDEYENRTY